MSLPTLYIKPGCPWCTEAITELDRQGIKYRTVDVISDPAAFAEMQQISRQTKAPVLNYHGDILADFGEAELKPFLAARRK